jgi:hypothetical protein
MGTCPKCGRVVVSVNTAEIDVNTLLGNTSRGIKYCCAHCSCVLGVAIDPITLKVEIIGEILRALADRFGDSGIRAA